MKFAKKEGKHFRVVNKPKGVPDTELTRQGFKPVIIKNVEKSPHKKIIGANFVDKGDYIEQELIYENKSLNEYKQEKIKELRESLRIELEKRYSIWDILLQLIDKSLSDKIMGDLKGVFTEYLTKLNEIKKAKSFSDIDKVYTKIIYFYPPDEIDENGHIIPKEPEHE